MITLDEFTSIYKEGGEVAAFLVVNDVVDKAMLFTRHPQLAHWLKTVELTDWQWICLAGDRHYREFMPYCDVRKRDFTFVSLIMYQHADARRCLDLSLISQNMWSRMIMASAREDIHYFAQYVKVDELTEPARAKYKVYRSAYESWKQSSGPQLPGP